MAAYDRNSPMGHETGGGETFFTKEIWDMQCSIAVGMSRFSSWCTMMAKPCLISGTRPGELHNSKRHRTGWASHRQVLFQWTDGG